MALEDAFLKHSVLAEGEKDDLREGDGQDEGSDIELEENQTLEDVVGPAPSVPYVPEDRPGHTTGPKGVLADKRAHDKEKRKEADREAMKATAAVHALGHAPVSATPSVSLSATAAAEAAALRAAVSIDAAHEEAAKAEETRGAAASGGGSSAVGEPGYVAASRAARLAALKSGTGGPYGEIHVVRDARDFLDAVNEAPAGIFVVVHMWEAFVPECQAVNALLPAVAAAAPCVRFLTALSTQLKRNFDPIALPCFILYAGGDTVATEVRVSDYMTEAHGGVTAAAIADCLMQMGVPAPLLAAVGGAVPGGAAPAAEAPPPAGAVRRSSLRPNPGVGAFMGAGSSVQGALLSAAEAGLEDMD